MFVGFLSNPWPSRHNNLYCLWLEGKINDGDYKEASNLIGSLKKLDGKLLKRLQAAGYKED